MQQRRHATPRNPHSTRSFTDDQEAIGKRGEKEAAIAARKMQQYFDAEGTHAKEEHLRAAWSALSAATRDYLMLVDRNETAAGIDMELWALATQVQARKGYAQLPDDMRQVIDYFATPGNAVPDDIRALVSSERVL